MSMHIIPAKRAEIHEKSGEKRFGWLWFYAYSGGMFRVKTMVAALLLMLLPAVSVAVAADGANTARDAVSPVAKAMSGVVASRANEPSDPADNQSGTSLPVPRFVTLAADEVNVRTGPGTRYPIRIVIRRGGLPVEIVKEHETWRKIRDVDGDEGWVHKAMLSGRRAVIIKGQIQPLLRKPDDTAPPVAKLEPGVIASLQACTAEWCDLKASSYEGWIRKTALWGVYAHETFKE